MVVRSVSVAESLCRERLKDHEPLVWGPVPAFQCAVAFSTRFGMIEFVVPEPGSKLVNFLGGKSVLHHVAFAVDDVRNPRPFFQGDLIFDEPAIAPVQRILVNFLKPLEGLLVEVVEEIREVEN
jgi:hypothetical protein